METFTNDRFFDSIIDLDGKVFDGCTFDGCVLRYRVGKFEIRNGFRVIGETKFDFGPHLDIQEVVFRFIKAGSDKPLDIDDQRPNHLKGPA